MIEYPYPRIREAALALLEDGPLSCDELAERLAGRDDLDELEDGDGLAEAIDQALLTDDTWERSDDRSVLARRITDGLVLTHRLTQQELDENAVVDEGDLEVLDWNADENRLQLDGGGETSLELKHLDPGWLVSKLSGPPGWLAEFRAGQLVSFTRRGNSISLAAVTDDLGDAEREVAALRRAVDTVMLPGWGDEVTSLMMEAMGWDPQLFRSAVRPVSELLVEAGLSQQGDFWGRSDEQWLLGMPGFEMQRRLATEEALERCCGERFARVCAAFEAFRSNETFDAAAVCSDLRHGPVVEVFAEHCASSHAIAGGALVAFAEALVAGARRHGPALFLLGIDADVRASAEMAERHFRSALDADSLGAASKALAGFEIDRGNYRRAISLLSHEDLDPDSHDLGFLRSLVEPGAEFAGTGRNEPCPCGSGRKFKQCHLNAAGGPTIDPIQLVMYKTARSLTHPPSRLILDSLTARIDDRHSESEFVFDVALWDGGIVADYLDRRGALLPPDERTLIERIVATPRALYEVVAVDRGTSLTMRDTKTGTERVVQEHLGSLDATEGQLMLTRVVESGGRDGFAGSSLKITLQQREGLMEVLDAGGRGRELLKWYGSATALPELQNREGEHLLLCHAEFSTPLDDEAVREALSLVLHEEEAGRFVELTELDNGETILRSTVRTSPGRIEIETNSIERLERVTEIVTDAVGDVEVVDVKVEDPRELLRDRLADSDSDSDAGEWDEDEDDDGDDEVASLQARPEPGLRS